MCPAKLLRQLPTQNKILAINDPVFVFSDPGIDDALALAMLARSKSLQMIGACGVDGNVSSQIAASNLGGLLKLFGAGETPVFRSSLEDPEHDYPVHVHGKNGLGNFRIVKPRLQNRGDLSSFLKSKGRFQILSLGPLTAVAELLNSAEVTGNISRIVMMGGGIANGNVTSYAEFNIYSNPEAADIVFSSSVPKVLIPLDVTEKVILYPEDLGVLKRKRSAAAKAISGMLKFYFNFEMKERGFFGGYMHDPSAVVAMTNPDLFKFRQAIVRVDTTGNTTRGRTVAKFSRSKEANTWVALGVDAEASRSVIMEGLVDSVTAAKS